MSSPVRFRQPSWSNILIGLAMCAAGAAAGQSVEPTPEQATAGSGDGQSYTFDDLTEGKIDGRLGKPVGTFCTVRGIWIEDPSRFKFTEWYFHVTHVDGVALPRSLEYPSYLLVDSCGGGQEKLADPVHGEVWVLRVFEGIKTYGSPSGYYDEARIPPGSGAIPFSVVSELKYVRGASSGGQSALQ
jgi:hypothetical protein